MGDGADMALSDMMDQDEAYCRGELDEDTGYPIMSPFQYEQKEHGPGPCPVCKGPTHIITSGPYGLFYGCNDFPNCKGRRSN